MPASLPTPTAGCPAHMQGAHTQALSTSLSGLCFRMQLLVVPSGGHQWGHAGRLSGFGHSLWALRYSPKFLFPESTFSNPSLPVIEVFWNGSKLHELIIISFWFPVLGHHLLASYHGRQGFGFFSCSHPPLHRYNFHLSMLIIWLYYKLGIVSFQCLHYCDYIKIIHRWVMKYT